MGVVIDCPDLVRRLPEQTKKDLSHTAYRLEMEGDQLVWVMHEGDTTVRYTTQLDSSAWTRLMVRLTSSLPIEWLL